MKCHVCDLAMTVDDQLSDTHDGCLDECGCWVCRFFREQRAQDRADDLAYDASREGL